MAAEKIEQLRVEPGSGEGPQQPEVFHYLDFRAFLRDYYHWRKTHNPRFSFRAFARRANIQSHSLIKMVMTGDRNLSADNAKGIARACELGANELSYFSALVNWNQCKSLDLREAYWNEVLRKKPRTPFHELRSNELEILTNWRAVTVLEMVRLSDFEPSGAWIAKRFRSTISASDAQDLLDQLLAAGLVEETSAGLQASHKTVFRGGDVPNALIQMYHHKVALQGVDALEHVDVTRREFTASTVAVRREDIPRLKEEVRKFQERVLGIAAGVDDSEEIYQLNVQLFPLTETGTASDPKPTKE